MPLAVAAFCRRSSSPPRDVFPSGSSFAAAFIMFLRACQPFHRQPFYAFMPHMPVFYFTVACRPRFCLFHFMPLHSPPASPCPGFRPVIVLLHFAVRRPQVQGRLVTDGERHQA